MYSLVQLCIKKGVKHIVISPGSRNAPLTLTFSRQSACHCYSIVDERTAAFFALGMAQRLQQPVALVCTSGTALLNYAPAIAEAYYQNIPLLVFSADRPDELIDQEEGQAIRQYKALANVVAKSYQLPLYTDATSLQFAQRLLNEGIEEALEKQKPIHINVPLREPLYQTQNYSADFCPEISIAPLEARLGKETLASLATQWREKRKVLIVVGFQPHSPKLNQALEVLATYPQVVVLTETPANLYSSSFIGSIDRVLAGISPKADYTPELLITLGGTLISKHIKTFLRQAQGCQHWHISQEEQLIDTYNQLSLKIPLDATICFEQLSTLLQPTDSLYKKQWQQLDEETTQRHADYLQKAQWSDLKAFDIIQKALPERGHLQLGNSSIVRYHQLFPQKKQLSCAANRGTSGIDGSTSTAVGAAYLTPELTTFISGDISFGYDSNALNHQYLSPNLRIIILNNGGGGIFRFIKGSAEQPELEEFFETHASSQSFEHLAGHWGIKYLCATNEESLKEQLEFLYELNEAAILEVETPRKENATILKDYFMALKANDTAQEKKPSDR